MTETIYISGGLGNQLFQFSFALELYFSRKRNIKLNISSYKNDKLREFELDKVIDLNSLDFITLEHERKLFSRVMFKVSKSIKKPILSHMSESSLIYNPMVKNNEICHYKGYWQSPKYFSNSYESILQLVNLKKFEQQKLLESASFRMDKKNISLHIRRGDYVSNESASLLHGSVCDMEYYKRAIEYFSNIKNTVFYIFSDDIEWCNESFSWLQNKKIVDFTSSHFEDLLLMTLCDHNIIANSTFSWWGAYLNKKENTVIAPKKWFNNNTIIDIYPETWKLL